MRDLFFGTPAIYLWCLMAALFVFGATYVGLVLRTVGGLRGVALVVLCLGLAIVTGGFAILLSRDPRIPGEVVGIAISTAFYPVVFSSLILVDIYAADHNDHRAISTITYLWFKRATAKDKRNV
jgi:hypothetical protein